MLYSFEALALGYLARPIGSLVFGHVGDRKGRKNILALSIFCMSVPSFLMIFLPTYQQIGIAAPILFVLFRFMQGFALGGEFSGAMVYVGEFSPPKFRAFFIYTYRQ